jgi:hypothetical protein
MHLSDCLSIVGIVMSTLMSVISIAVALHLYRKERKERNDKFLDWIVAVVKELVEFVLEKVEGILSRRTAQPDGVRTERASSEKPDHHTRSSEENQSPPGQQQGESVDGPSRDVSQPEITGNNARGRNTPTGSVDRDRFSGLDDADDTGSKRRIRHDPRIVSGVDPETPGPSGPGINRSN